MLPPNWWIKLHWKKKVNTFCVMFFFYVWIWRIIFSVQVIFPPVFFSYIITVVEWGKKLNLLYLQHTRFVLEHFTFIIDIEKLAIISFILARLEFFYYKWIRFADEFFYLGMDCRLKVTSKDKTLLAVTGIHFKWSVEPFLKQQILCFHASTRCTQTYYLIFDFFQSRRYYENRV